MPLDSTRPKDVNSPDRALTRERLKGRRAMTLDFTVALLPWDPRADPDSLGEVVGPTSVRLVTSAQTQTEDSLDVLAGLDPAIHAQRRVGCRFSWMPGTRPGKAIRLRLHHMNASEH
jgi:hypothetical protein